ncbi:MAG: glycosyltransferase family 2 protein [Candidatus Hodarchaeales archaeon]
MRKSLKVLIGIPVYNEENFIFQGIQDIITFIRSNPGTSLHNYDFLVVDDGSTDNSFLEFQKVQKKYPEIKMKYIKHEKNLGYGNAIISIFRYSKQGNYDVVITFDADLQHDPSTIPLIIEQVSNGVDFVSASRYLDKSFIKTPETIPLDRYLINMMITRLFNEVFDINLSDSFCGLKAYKVSRIDHFLSLEERGYAMPLELLLTAKKHDMRFTEIPTPCIYLENRRPRKDWKDRIDNYARAIKKFSWTKKQKIKVRRELNYIKDILEFRLSEMDNNEIKSFSDFWKETIFNFRLKNEETGNCCGCKMYI